MEIMKESEFRRQIKSGLGKCYLFFGDEDYMKSFAVNAAIDAVSPDPTLSFFNVIKLDSFSYSPDALLSAIMPAPMMADKKIIILSGLDFTSMKQSEADALCQTVAALDEYDYNTLIINTAAGCFDAGFLPKRPSSMLQKLSEHMTPVVFEKNSPARLSSWVSKHFEHNGVQASPEVCALVVERCGRDMFNLSSETDKISFYVKGNGKTEVLSADVEAVSVSADEYDAFAFTNAIGARRKDAALNVLRDMKLRRVDPIIIMGEVTKTVCDTVAVRKLASEGLTSREISDILKLHEYKISIILKNDVDLEMCERLLERCRDADLEIKLSRDGYAVLEKFICTI